MLPLILAVGQHNDGFPIPVWLFGIIAVVIIVLGSLFRRSRGR